MVPCRVARLVVDCLLGLVLRWLVYRAAELVVGCLPGQTPQRPV